MHGLILPKYVAVMGYPTAGKDTVGKALKELFHYQQLDDGAPIREVCQLLFGWSIEDQRNLDFKNSMVTVPGYDQPVTVRRVQQDTGRMLENKFGDYIMPITAMNRTRDDENRYAATSVRMKQGWCWRENGALVIGVTRDGAVWDGTESENYDEACPHAFVHNTFNGTNGDAAYSKIKGDVFETVRAWSLGLLND